MFSSLSLGIVLTRHLLDIILDTFTPIYSAKRSFTVISIHYILVIVSRVYRGVAKTKHFNVGGLLHYKHNTYQRRRKFRFVSLYSQRYSVI